MTPLFINFIPQTKFNSMYREGMSDCKLYSSFNILIHLLIFVLRYLWSEAFNKISGEFSQRRKGKERGQRLKEKKWDSFEWENKTMKISRHIADASIVLWPSPAWSWEQLNPSLTNKSRFSSKPGEDFIKKHFVFLEYRQVYCISSLPVHISN